MEAVLGLDSKRRALLDGALGAHARADPATDAVADDAVAVHSRRGAVHAVRLAENRVHAQVEVLHLRVAHREDDVDVARVAGVDVREVRLLLVDEVADAHAFLPLKRHCGARKADHLVEARAPDRLDAPIAQEVAGERLATRGEEVHRVGLVVERADAAHLGGSVGRHVGDVERADEFQLL